MDGALDDRYDFALLGTSLPLSILSAALARAGFSVLHVDDAEQYGGPWASLTLQELVSLAKSKERRSHSGILDIDIAFAGASSTEVPAELAAVSRHFAISLAPTLLPCAGPTIDVLIRSKVANYCTFRLLQQTAVYSSEGRAKDAFPLRSVPSSKEDIFKDKSLSLADKRRLMKLLQQAAPKQQSPTERDGSTDVQNSNTAHNDLSGTFYDYLISRNGPGFSERLASDVAYGVALCASRDESAVSAMHRIQRHIVSVGRYGNSAYLVGQYGGAGEMAQCYCRASAVQGGTFVLAHSVSQLEPLRQTSTYERSETLDDGNGDQMRPRWRIALDGIQGSSQIGCVVGDVDLLKRVGKTKEEQTRPQQRQRQAVGILCLDRGMCIQPATAPSSSEQRDANTQTADAQTGEQRAQPPETALVVFPPSDDGGDSLQAGSVWALQMGEGTFSCPKGTYLVYLCAALPFASAKLQTAGQARLALQHAREGVLHLAQRSSKEWQAERVPDGERQDEHGSGLNPLFECYMVREVADQSYHAEVQGNGGKQVDEEYSARQMQTLDEQSLLSVESSLTNLATSLDEATIQAEDLYWLLCGRDGVGRERAEVLRRRQRRAADTYAVGRGLGGVPRTGNETSEEQGGEQAAVCDFFPVPDDVDEDN